MSQSSTAPAASGGVGFLSLLTLAFIVLRLVGVIDWSWVWVLAPIWMPVAITLLFLILTLSVMVVWALLDSR